MQRRVFTEIDIEIIDVGDKLLLTSGFNGDYAGMEWDYDD